MIKPLSLVFLRQRWLRESSAANCSKKSDDSSKSKSVVEKSLVIRSIGHTSI